MTTKEKAQELLSHYNSILIDEISHGGARGYASYKCALITVDEIIQSLDKLFGTTKECAFYKQVKQEIEKL